MNDDDTDRDLTGHRASPLEATGGVRTGPPGAPPEDPHYGYVPSRVHEHKHAKVPHPPLRCPNPTRMSTMRGYYHCPGCGAKVKLAEEISWADWKAELSQAEEEALDHLAAALYQCWAIAWESAWYLLRLAIWAALRLYDAAIGRLKSKRTVTGNSGGVAPEMIWTAVILAKIMAGNAGNAVTSANKPEEISS